MTFACPYCPLTTVPHEHERIKWIEESGIYITGPCRHGVIPDYLCQSCLDYWELDHKIKLLSSQLDNIGFVAEWTEEGNQTAKSFDDVVALFNWLEEYVLFHGKYPDELRLLREQVLFASLN